MLGARRAVSAAALPLHPFVLGYAAAMVATSYPSVVLGCSKEPWPGQEPALFLGLFSMKAGITTERRPAPQGEALSLPLAAMYGLVWSSQGLGNISVPQKGRMFTLKPALTLGKSPWQLSGLKGPQGMCCTPTAFPQQLV